MSHHAHVYGARRSQEISTRALFATKHTIGQNIMDTTGVIHYSFTTQSLAPCLGTMKPHNVSSGNVHILSPDLISFVVVKLDDTQLISHLHTAGIKTRNAKNETYSYNAFFSPKDGNPSSAWRRHERTGTHPPQ